MNLQVRNCGLLADFHNKLSDHSDLHWCIYLDGVLCFSSSSNINLEGFLLVVWHLQVYSLFCYSEVMLEVYHEMKLLVLIFLWHTIYGRHMSFVSYFL